MTFDELEKNLINYVKPNYERGWGKVASVGSCALCAVVVDNKVFIANLGDSKGVIFKKSNNELTVVSTNKQMNAD